MELSIFLVLILQISSFQSLAHKSSSCGFENCKSDPAIDDAVNEFKSSEEIINGIDASCKAKFSTLKHPESKDMALNFAQTAADAAQAANEAQAGAAQEAARQVKIKKAEEATDAERKAQVALVVSLACYSDLAGDLSFEETMLQQMNASMEACVENARTAEIAFKRVEQQTAVVQDEIVETRTSMEQLDALFNETSEELKEKNNMLIKIKERVEFLTRQMEEADREFKKAKEAADQVDRANKMKAKKMGRFRKVIPHNHGRCLRRKMWS